MKLKIEWPLEAEAESTPTSTSGNSPAEPAAPSTPSEPSTPSGSEPVDWNALSEPESGTEEEVSTPAVPPKSPATPPATPSTSAAATPPVPPSPAPKPGEPTQPPAPAPQPPAPPVAPPAAETPEQKLAREKLAQEAQEANMKKLEEFYKLGDDLSARFQTEPENVLPILAGRLHMEVLNSARRMFEAEMPKLLHQYQQVQEANASSKEAFYSRWPSLKGKDAEVLQIGEMHFKMNPNQTPAERLEAVGKLACAALGIQPDAAPSSGNGSTSPTPPSTPKAPATPGFRPGGTQSSNAGATKPTDNPFIQMANEMLEDEQSH